jgi:succinate dehydrogenase / fumarate reductase iron-sulfur subunit
VDGTDALHEDATVRLRVRRSEPKSHWDEFEVPLGDRMTVLDGLFYVLRERDRSLAFRCACRAAMCGSCAMVIDGSEALACRTPLPKGTVRVEPLRHLPVIKDLVVEMEPLFDKYAAVEPWVTTALREPAVVSPDDPLRKQIGEGLDCITCGACYSACPMVGADPDYLGPLQLLRAFNVLADERDQHGPERDAEVYGRHGVWRCRGIGECTRVCPKGLDPSEAIRRLKRDALLRAFS